MEELTVIQRIERALSELATLDRQKFEAEQPFAQEYAEATERLNAVVGKMAEATAGIRQHIEQTEALIRQEGVKLTASVKDTQSGYQCVHVSGGLEWNKEMLKGYSVAHPDVLGCATKKKPSVQIRRK
jgi:hypothetical protein